MELASQFLEKTSLAQNRKSVLRHYGAGTGKTVKLLQVFDLILVGVVPTHCNFAGLCTSIGESIWCLICKKPLYRGEHC